MSDNEIQRVTVRRVQRRRTRVHRSSYTRVPKSDTCFEAELYRQMADHYMRIAEMAKKASR